MDDQVWIGRLDLPGVDTALFHKVRASCGRVGRADVEQVSAALALGTWHRSCPSCWPPRVVNAPEYTGWERAAAFVAALLPSPAAGASRVAELAPGLNVGRYTPSTPSRDRLDRKPISSSRRGWMA
ncbi:hypothetical protein [Micromonospora sediminicola]|uniref:hypothetical protein n=1 Tax=Micromonospora sediminicola TaxID=946078 RepID=UPI0037885455